MHGLLLSPMIASAAMAFSPVTTIADALQLKSGGEKMICPQCGAPVADKRFCTQCGARLVGTEVAAEPIADPAGRQPAVSRQPAQAAGALTGRVLDQRYYIESKLGVGGMGTVYLGRRLLIGDNVAIKVLHPEQVAKPEAVERFRREAQTAARLKHPNVATVYDFGESEEGLIYLVMELAEGESLRRLIEREGAMSETFAAEVTRQVCAALDAAHSQGVVHRDVKPENILVQTTPNGLQVKVLDFGIAALRDIAADKLTRTGAIVGTPHYMSPEHCLGEELDGRSDIYSLGIVLFEMLTGSVPFESPTPTAVIIQQVNQSPPPLRTLNPNISLAVEAVVLHSLDKRRESRPQSVGELSRQLIEAVNNPDLAPPNPTVAAAQSGVTPVPITTPTLVESPAWNSSEATRPNETPSVGDVSAKPESSGKLVILLFAALLLLAVVAGSGLWWFMQKGENGKVATTSDSAGGNQQTSPVTPDRNATVSPAASPGPVNQASVSNNLWELIPDQTSGVTDAANALGPADQQVAVINPGGQLALAYREGQFFGNGPGADLRVIGPEHRRVTYLIFVRDDPATDWQRIDINRKGFPQGAAPHDMGHHGVSRARQLMIRNIGDADLSVDAINVVYKDKASSESRARAHH